MSGIRQIVPAPDGGRRFRAYTAKHLDALTTRAGLGEAERLAVRAVGTVLPFRTNAYVIDELIDWTAAPDDPLYRLVFPQADMLPAADVARIAGLLAVSDVAVIARPLQGTTGGRARTLSRYRSILAGRRRPHPRMVSCPCQVRPRAPP